MNPAEFADILDSTTAEILRPFAAASFRDTFAAYVKEWTTVDGLDEEDWVLLGDTPGKIPNKVSGGDASNARTENVGGVERTVIEGGLHLPWEAEPQVGMEYLLVELGPTTHPSMLNRRYRVIETHPTSRMTAWRLDVCDMTPAEED